MKTGRDRNGRIWAGVALAAVASVGCGGDESGPVVEAGDASHQADCDVIEAGPPTPDCRQQGNECADGYYCTTIYSVNRYECNPESFLEQCPSGYCLTQGRDCLPNTGRTLCNSDKECCEGVACIDGRCETR